MGRDWGKEGKTDLLNRVEKGQAEGLCGKLGRAGRTCDFPGPCGLCGKVVRSHLAELCRLRRGTDLGRGLSALGVGVLQHRQRALDLVLEDALEDVDLALDVDERRLELVHVDRPSKLEVQLVQRQEV